MEAIKLASPGQSISPDVWTAAFARRTKEWQVALIPLERLGFSHDSDGFQESNLLTPIAGGAEAFAYLDDKFEVVYKLFNLNHDGSLGKKLAYEREESGEYGLTVAPARLVETIEKLELLHNLGAHPTEIVGLSENGDYLIVKQPRAYPESYSGENMPPGARVKFEEDREKAISRIRGIQAESSGFRRLVAASHFEGQNWLISDLHTRNIMRDSEGLPTIIDALTGIVSPAAYDRHPTLREACEYSKQWRRTGQHPVRRSILDTAEDHEL